MDITARTQRPAATAHTGAPPPRHGALVATLWGSAGLVAGAGGTVLVALPAHPGNADGWAELGWLVYTGLAAVVVAVLAGAWCVGRGLRRAGHPHCWVVAGVFVPVALLLGAVTAGVGALAAPALAWWLVSVVSRRGERTD